MLSRHVLYCVFAFCMFSAVSQPKIAYSTLVQKAQEFPHIPFTIAISDSCNETQILLQIIQFQLVQESIEKLQAVELELMRRADVSLHHEPITELRTIIEELQDRILVLSENARTHIEGTHTVEADSLVRLALSHATESNIDALQTALYDWKRVEQEYLIARKRRELGLKSPYRTYYLSIRTYYASVGRVLEESIKIICNL